MVDDELAMDATEGSESKDKRGKVGQIDWELEPISW